MSIPVWVLLLFAGWTLLIMMACLGTYRLSRIISGRARASDYSFPDLEKSDWHRRASRAHLNCLETLPVYGAIVVAIVATGVASPILDRLAIAFLVARILHSFTHLLFPQTDLVTMLRFVFFSIQLLCMIWMGIFLATHA